MRTLNSAGKETFDTSVDDLYRRHAGDALRVARSITRNADDAADAVAEAFAGVGSALQHGRVADPASLRGYLMAATRNAAIDVVRRAGRVTPAGDDPAPRRHETVPGPSDRLIAGADRSIVAEAFGDLSPRWRAVLWLTEVEGYSPRDAAVLLRATPNNVAQLGVRARGRLRERYVQLHVRNHATGECLEVTERLGGLVAGEHTAPQVGRVRGHMAECAGCRAGWPSSMTWIRAEQVRLVTHDFRIIVELGFHRITAYQGGKCSLPSPLAWAPATRPRRQPRLHPHEQRRHCTAGPDAASRGAGRDPAAIGGPYLPRAAINRRR